MTKISLKGNPFYLNNEQISWVHNTIAEMTIEEKIGQLFFPMGMTTKESELIKVINEIKPGGMMYRPSAAKKVIKAHRALQKNSKIPLFLAANLETGGDGIIDEGTFFGTNMQVGASNNLENAYRLGYLSNIEGSYVGCNMAFAPVIDINYNFRNPITNVRSFGDKPDLVAKMSAEYVKGTQAANCAVTIKHFPGDGTDSRDQHLVSTQNHLSYETWMRTYGKVYEESIKIGARGLMVGHISFPAFIKKFFPDDTEQITVPATLNKYLINELLRKKLAYNGLTMTDASLMTGFGSFGKRKDLVPLSIAAGCDMFLFNRNINEDYAFMMEGYKNGIITDERLEDALTRILALKAAMNLPQKSLDELVPKVFINKTKALHKEWSAKLADESVTLVRDDQNVLPLSPSSIKKVGVIFNGNDSGMAALFKNVPGFKGFLIRSLMGLSNRFGEKKYSPTESFVNCLKAEGFDAFEYSFGDIFKVLKDLNKPLKAWTDQFDLIIFLTKWETLSNQTSLQMQYKAIGFDAPWFVQEIPTILVSISNPYQGFDVPMIKTVINGYSPKDDVYEAIVKKLVGKSAFKGTSPVDLNFNEFDPSKI